MHTLRLFFLALLVCLGAAHTVQAAPFVSPNGYSITPAPQWQVNHNSMTRADVSIFTRATKQVTPILRVMISPVQQGQTLEQIQGQITTGYSHILKQFKIVGMRYETVNNVRALHVDGTHLVGMQLLALHQDMVLKSGKLFIFTYGTPISMQTQYAPAFAQMLRSVRWSR